MKELGRLCRSWAWGLAWPQCYPAGEPLRIGENADPRPEIKTVKLRATSWQRWVRCRHLLYGTLLGTIAGAPGRRVAHA